MKRLLAGLTLLAASTLGAQERSRARTLHDVTPDTTASDFTQPLPANGS